MAFAVVAATIGVSFALIQVPVVARILFLEPLHWDDWAVVLLAIAIPSLLLTVNGLLSTMILRTGNTRVQQPHTLS
jgi:hypothetical protein